MESALLGLLLLAWSLSRQVSAGMDSCIDDQGSLSRCLPKFENAAFNKTVMASNVCGLPPEDYCMQAGSTRSCHHCDASDPQRHHNVTYLTDFHSDEEPTWWQSQSMFYGVQHPRSVNLTLHLGKAFEITYIRLKFHTSRPESFAIYRRSKEGGPWLPYQYYSASCQKTYGKNAKGYIRPGEDERMALCTDEFSDISPLTGGNVAFSTLEGRPSAYNFDQSPVLQEWVTATDLLISLDRLNTFGDEFFKDPKVLRSYYYAISDFSVGGRCKCNGHASECLTRESGELVCTCQHHTDGADCQRCQPFYQDRPWARATADSANECRLCNCSGRTDACIFDAELYRSTGSGGRCASCRDNTDGPHCERCRENFYRNSPSDVCLPCNCSSLGSSSLQCENNGVCHCRQGVTGEKCEDCQPGFHSLGPAGCRPCECHPSGSAGVCSPLDGQCPCKTNVEGHTCGRCKPGSFNLASDNPAGCESCFCFGHSVACASSTRHSAISITSDFAEDPDGWTGEFSGGLEFPLIWKEGEVYLLPYSEDDIGFYKSPERFLGNQLLSYGQLLSIAFVAESLELLPRRVTVVLEASAVSVSIELSPEPSPRPVQAPRHTFTLRLHERDGGLRPSLSALEFRRLLFNLTALKISNAGGHNYTSQLSRVTLGSAAPSHSPYPPAPWVEECACPPGYAGQFCERCAPGYKREVPNGGPFVRCVPCTCNQHGDCHPDTGVCQCTGFTTGPACELCLDGYYGNALTGSSGNCQSCPCPEQTSCAQVPETGEVVCTNCPPGQRGTRCQICDDGFYGDPLGKFGIARPCTPCDCHGNVDPNAVGVCDNLTGRCLKCLYHTEGDHCQHCQQGYYGNALDQKANKCEPCSCNPAGTAGPIEDCHPHSGQCFCLSHVTGQYCGHCMAGYFNLSSGLGCERCNCNPIGSSSPACHPITGQCVCHPGVEGSSCDSCRKGFFGFSSRGCRACNCDPMGSITMQCHGNGTCTCREGFVGYKCDKCELNYFQSRATYQCEGCPVCYGLVRDQAEKLQLRLQSLEKLLARHSCRGRRGRQHQTLQGEDTLPNALEDFLAIQEAREAFVSQFTQLETSARTVAVQLRSIAMAMNCSREDNAVEWRRRACGAVAGPAAAVGTAQGQLRQAIHTLGSMVIPFEVQTGPNRWTTLVNESQALGKSHKEAASHIESIAKKALMASNQTFSLLMALLEDNSTEVHFRSLTEQLLEMHQAKVNLTAQANETLSEAKAACSSIQEDSAQIASALVNFTSSTLHLTNDSQSNLVWGQAELFLSQDLNNRTGELDLLVRSKDELVLKIQEELAPHVKSVEKHMETIQKYNQAHAKLSAQVQQTKAAALSSVVKGKGIESQSSGLMKDLEDMRTGWPSTLVQTKAIVKKERLVEEKILGDAKKKTKQAERIVKPALDNSTLSNTTASQAKTMTDTVTKEAKDARSQAKSAKNASAQLSSSVDTVLQQLEDQERSAVQMQTDTTNETEDTVGGMRENIEAAKLKLESHSVALSELLSKIEGDMANEKFERILRETETWLGFLRNSVESPVLSKKIQALHDAAQDQEAQLLQVDRDIAEIKEERRSLQDIVLHLPQGCTEGSKVGTL
ncbi:hypothetical protein AAFF_G00337150 [Aldrovandia affinis]|uniref:Laminin subunit gamma-3 n=1 Tax=Aldrovandia affinis TaxID=143900 RepID=A0AAD7SLH4_9TELE|nr:hypothetical protein AAFF_G00337150 [Aldrovandia affinis]